MATSCTGANVSIKVGAVELIANTTAKSGSLAHAVDYEKIFATGTGNQNVNLVASYEISHVDTGTTTYDVRSLTDSSGATISMVKLVATIIENTSAFTIICGNATSNQLLAFTGAAAHTIAVRPYSTVVLIARDGYTTSGTDKDFKILASGGTVTGRILFLGKTA